MTRNEAMKTAALSLRKLSADNEKLKTDLEKRAQAEKIVSSLIEAGYLDANKVLVKLAEYEKQSLDELRTLEKAIELSNNKEITLKFGSLSDDANPEDYDPITQMCLE